MTRVLVTGARGFVGRPVTAALAAAGLEVHGTSLGATGSVPGVVAMHQVDLLDAVASRRLISAIRPNALVHLAWCAKPPSYWSDLDNVRWTAASLELLRAFADAGGTRVVAVGTCAEYDWSAGHCDERTTPIAPSTLYGASKAALGTLLQAFSREARISAAWARLFFMFGPGDSPARLVPTIVSRLQAGLPAHCTSGSHIRDFLFVDDVADALVALLKSPVVGAINVASGVPTSVGSLAATVAEKTGRSDLLRVDDGSRENAVVVADVTRLRDEVGWVPRTPIDAALDETVRWWQRHATVDTPA